MTEFLKNWLLALAGAAVVCSLAVTLTPEGRFRRITSLVCGAAMIAALISPLCRFDTAAYASGLAQYRAAAAQAAGDGEKISEALNRTYIQEQCEAYILDKAEKLGANVDVRITARWDTGGWWYPYSAQITGDAGGGKSALTEAMEAELGIPAQRQDWSGADG
ncbi:MAG TPA: hypothetical protein PLD83_02670 [Oscillospiraceae bacterium]|nr:hypothetical protein [Oscillospiraceae bacterium]